MSDSAKPTEGHKDIYPDRLLDGRVYRDVTQKTIDLAFDSYRIARRLSIASFFVGIALLILATTFALLFRDSALLSALFGVFGTANIVALLVTRPIDRIQAGIGKLVEAQIGLLNFAAAYEAIARYLVAASELPFDDKSRDLQKEFDRARFLMQSALRALGTEMPPTAEE